ncbi:MAG: energy-coupling factor ABC transporter permease [Methanomicrobiales archaeon]|nr:energy-coupling factor ABC transporter permease [Methanomicrobiales archaeon]
MHISDGILSPVWVMVWFFIAFLFLVIGTLKIQKRVDRDPSYLPLLAMMGAAVFLIAVWHIPVPVTGSSSHPVGTPMAAIVIGPFGSVVISFIVLIFHAFLGHGGITTIGANTVSMGVAGSFSGYSLYRILRKGKISIWMAAGLAALVGDLLTYVVTALEFALSLNPNAVLPSWMVYSLMFLPTQLPIALAEFVFTAAIVQYIAQRRPDILVKAGGNSDVL